MTNVRRRCPLNECNWKSCRVVKSLTPGRHFLGCGRVKLHGANSCPDLIDVLENPELHTERRQFHEYKSYPKALKNNKELKRDQEKRQICQQDDSVGKNACHQACWPEFDLYSTKIEPTPPSCSKFHTYAMAHTCLHTQACTHTHTYTHGIHTWK